MTTGSYKARFSLPQPSEPGSARPLMSRAASTAGRGGLGTCGLLSFMRTSLFALEFYFMLNRRCIFLTEGAIKFLSWKKLASEQGVNQGDVAGQGSGGED